MAAPLFVDQKTDILCRITLPLLDGVQKPTIARAVDRTRTSAPCTAQTQKYTQTKCSCLEPFSVKMYTWSCMHIYVYECKQNQFCLLGLQPNNGELNKQ